MYALEVSTNKSCDIKRPILLILDYMKTRRKEEIEVHFYANLLFKIFQQISNESMYILVIFPLVHTSVYINITKMS